MSDLVSQNLNMIFNTPKGETVHALKDVSFTLKKGELLTVLGPSGCGKTTLLNITAGFLRPTSGKINLNKKEIDGHVLYAGIAAGVKNLLEYQDKLDEINVFPVPDDTAFVAAYTLPSIDGQQILSTSIEGFDPSGNHGVRNLDIAFRWMDNAGGTLASADDGRVILNVPMLVSGVGRLAVIARLGAEDVLRNDEGRPIYFIDLASGARFEPVSLNFFVGQEATEEIGILRWDNYQNRWQQLDTIVDSKSGWLTSAIDRPGYFRTGTVSETLRRQSQKLASHPNPFVTRNSLYTQIEYEVLVPGPVELQVVNVLGQKTRILVEESFHDIGLWNVLWDGRDDRGNAVASGVYFCHLKEKVERRLLPLLVVR